MLTLLLSVLVNVGTVFGQYDVTTQGIHPTQITGAGTQATSNIGQFVVNPNTNNVHLIGNSGNTISTVGPFESRANISVATNHDSYLAVVTTGQINGERDPEIRVYVYNNSGSTTFSPNVGVLRMPASTVLPSNTVDVNKWVRKDIVPHSPFDGIHWVETNMDDTYLYIAWQLNSRRLGFAIMNLSNFTWAVAPSDIPEPFPGTRNPAQGSIPTIGCYRWALNQVHIAYVADQGGQPYDFRPNVPFNFATDPVVALPLVRDANNIARDIEWVRVVSYDHFSGATGEHYYYGTKSFPFDPYRHELWTTTGAGNAPTGPHTTNLVYEPYNDALTPHPAILNPVPPMGVANPYHITGTPSTQSVYCIYKEWETYAPGQTPNPPTGTLRYIICRQGGANQLTLFTNPIVVSDANSIMRYYTAGVNQMGVFANFEGNPGMQLWRSFEHFTEDIRENTLATGLNWYSPDNPQHTLTILQGDTLRVYGDVDDNLRTFRFIDASVLSPYILSVGYQFTNTNFSQTAKRAHLMLDNNAIIDFENGLDVQINAHGRGSIQYDGATLNNMVNIHWSLTGNLNSGDTTENFKALFYINAALTLKGYLWSNKGQIRFIGASTQPAMAKLSVLGSGRSILLDNSTMILGSQSTLGPLTQIEMNVGVTVNNGQGLTIINSLITTGWQSSLIYTPTANTSVAATRSDIILNRPGNVTITGNNLLYSYFQIDNPQGNITFNTNKMSLARNGFKFNWNTTGQYSNVIRVLSNNVRETWPIGTTQDDPTDFIFRGLIGLHQDDIIVEDNVFGFRFGSPFPIIQPNHTAIDFQFGTVGQIMENTVDGRAIGIHTEGTGQTNPYLCLNDIDGTSTSYGIGIKQDGSGTGNISYVKLNTVTNFNIAYQSAGKDESVLINNYFENSQQGVQSTGNSKVKLNGYTVAATGAHVKAQNRIRHNSDAQIVIADDAQPEIGAPQSVPQEQLVDWAQNDIDEEGLTNPVHMKYVSGTNPQYILDKEVTYNHWDAGILHIGTCATGEPNVNLLTYFSTGASPQPSGDFDCNEILTGTKSSRENVQSITNYPPVSDYDDRLYYEAEKLAAMGKNREAFDTMRVFCEKYYMLTYPEKGGYSVADGLGDCAGYALAEFSKTKSTVMMYEVYNWLVSMQPKNSDCRYYQNNLFNGLANMLSHNGFQNYNEACNMWYNFTQLCPDNGWRDSMFYGFIKSVRGYQTEIPQDTTPFYLYSYPLKPLLSVVSSGKTVAAVGSIRVFPNPTLSKTKLDVFMSVNADVIIQLNDILGIERETLYIGKLEKGEHSIDIDLRDVTAGVYYVRLSSPSGEVKTVKVVKE